MAGPRARPSAVPRACANGRVEPGLAQTAAVIVYHRWLGVVGTRGCCSGVEMEGGGGCGLAMKNSNWRAEAQLFIDTVAPTHGLLGLKLDSISNLILTWGLLRFERRFSFGVHWGFLLSTIPCSDEGRRLGQRWAARP
jgi:hypothetical protein